jgi:hypothetical protein
MPRARQFQVTLHHQKQLANPHVLTSILGNLRGVYRALPFRSGVIRGVRIRILVQELRDRLCGFTSPALLGQYFRFHAERVRRFAACWVSLDYEIEGLQRRFQIVFAERDVAEMELCAGGKLEIAVIPQEVLKLLR